MKIFVDGNGNNWSSTDDDSVCLSVDRWNDFSFVTQFGLSVRLKDGGVTHVGKVKIGFRGQTEDIPTHTKITPHQSDALAPEFFSVGQDVSYYKTLADLPDNKGRQVLLALRDVVATPTAISEISTERVFEKSIMREVSLASIHGQFERAMNRGAQLTPFKFKFVRPSSNELGAIDLSFQVKVSSRPSTNIHALIGRNGIGKTTLLNGMIDAIAGSRQAGEFFDLDSLLLTPSKIGNEYFSNLVSVSFSAFDPFSPPREQSDPSKGTCYYYIGLKNPERSHEHLTIQQLQVSCIDALVQCLRNDQKRRRWLAAIDKLGSDDNFERMHLQELVEKFDQLSSEIADEGEFSTQFFTAVQPLLAGLSSGHAIILLTLTRLVATVEEKTLVVVDEPESHLHPPLLSAFIRALADLLHDQNGVAIIATHSPVVLQEIPKACVWKINRHGESISTSRPTIETFGENVGQLTSEIFNLEVRRSGFHAMLERDVQSGGTYDEIVARYEGQLGLEGRTILSILIATRDRGG